MSEYSYSLQRIFIGENYLFYTEILLRVFTIYFYTLFLLRLIGRRQSSQMTLIDLMLVIALGSAVGDAMFYQQVPLLYSMLVITMIVLFQKGITVLTKKSRFLHKILESNPLMIVRDGGILNSNLGKSNFSKEDLLIKLREKGVAHLSEVDRAYLEPSGKLSVYKKEVKNLEDSILPEFTEKV